MNNTSRILCAAAIPATPHLVYATGTPELIYPPHTRVSLDALPHGIAAARYVVLDDQSLPEQRTIILLLLEGRGLRIFDWPSLERPKNAETILENLQAVSAKAHTFSLDSLGSDLVSESFRVALAIEDSVKLLDVNIPRAKVTVLGRHAHGGPATDRLCAVAFSEMTIVASTIRLHYMLRISRGGGLAVAATVPRLDRLRRSGNKSAVDGPASGVSWLFGGLFQRRNIMTTIAPVLAHALPDNRWLLTVDDELITYSSFGAKLEDMENVFKSKVGMEASDIASVLANTATGSKKPSSSTTGPDSRTPLRPASRPEIVKSPSNSSLGSVGTTMTHMTFIDQSTALRAEKPPSVTVFSSPFVMSVTSDNELMAFAANGSIPGVINTLSLIDATLPEPDSSTADNDEDDEKTKAQKQKLEEQRRLQQQQKLVGVRLVACRHERTLAIAFWPNGTVVAINLVDDLDSLTERQEQENQLRFALALVPTDQTDRMIALRRLLSTEARAANWHDAAMHHFQVVVNLSFRMDGIDQVDLVAEAVELRGPTEASPVLPTSKSLTNLPSSPNSASLSAALSPSASSYNLDLHENETSSWHDNIDTATMWADFLFRLRRRIMRPSPADVDVLETLCYADESSDRVKALLSVRHDIGLSAGEALIKSPRCVMREEERVEALVSLYTSLAEHEKALVLLENTELTNSFDGVAGYLASSMRSTDDPDVFFDHFKWLANRSVKEAQGKAKLDQLIHRILSDCDDLEMAMSRLMEALVEEVDELAVKIIQDFAPPIASSPSQSTDNSSNKSNSEDVSLSGVPSKSNAPGVLPTSSNHKSESTKGFKKVEVSADAIAAGILAGMVKANAMSKRGVFDKLRLLFNERILLNTEASYHAYTLLQAIQTEEFKALELHEEQAYLLGQQGRHEAAADELAAEKSLKPDEALSRLTRMLPAADKGNAAENLVAAYLRVSAQGRAIRVADAAEIVKCSAGSIEIEKVVLDGRCADDALSLADMWPLLRESIVAASDRLRIAECVRAIRRSEIARLREEVLMRRRRFVVVGNDRACTLCTRRIGESVFVAYPDGSVAHLACHMSRDSR